MVKKTKCFADLEPCGDPPRWQVTSTNKPDVSLVSCRRHLVECLAEVERLAGRRPDVLQVMSLEGTRE